MESHETLCAVIKLNPLCTVTALPVRAPGDNASSCTTVILQGMFSSKHVPNTHYKKVATRFILSFRLTLRAVKALSATSSSVVLPLVSWCDHWFTD
jgi:hypothetical protein